VGEGRGRSPRIGVTLPSFSRSPERLVEAAREADRLGIHGGFVFDHLWPMHSPGRPALAMPPLLGVLARATSRLVVGPLVARVGLWPAPWLEQALRTAAAVSGGRVIAALGTGDEKSLDEHRGYGLPYADARSRREVLERLGRRLLDAGLEVWVGAGRPGTNRVARRLGASLNLWDVEPEELAVAAREGPVTWGGPLPRAAEEAARRLSALADAGAEWVVWAWPGDLRRVVEAARLAGVDLGRRGAR